MSSPKPTILFLPCAWHTTAYYAPVRTALSTHGYSTAATALTSLNPRTNIYDFSEDVKVIKDAVTKIVEEGKDVILVCHSYSGLPGPEALRGLGKLERQKNGEKGGVTRLVFVMAIMLPEGKGTAPYGDVSVIPPHVIYDKEVRPSISVSSLPMCSQDRCPAPRSSSISQRQDLPSATDCTLVYRTNRTQRKTSLLRTPLSPLRSSTMIFLQQKQRHGLRSYSLIAQASSGACRLTPLGGIYRQHTCSANRIGASRWRM
jgi:hypothetical protein